MKLINLDDGVTVASLAKVRERVEENPKAGSSEEQLEETAEEEKMPDEEFSKEEPEAGDTTED